MKRMKKYSEKGFTLIEVMVSMGLLAFVMSTSMTVLSIVMDMTRGADYSLVVTQESNYASERIKRLVRSADSFSVNPAGTLIINVGTNNYSISVTTDADGRGSLREGSASIMSSEVYIIPLEIDGTTYNYFEIIREGLVDVGVRMAFEVRHKDDDNNSYGTFTFTQAISRNAILR